MEGLLLLFMSVPAPAFFPFVGLDLLAFAFLSAGHSSSCAAQQRQLDGQFGNHVFEFVGRLEDRYFAVRNRDNVSGPRIARLTSFSQLDLECAEPPDFDVVSCFQRFLDGL